MSDVGLMEKVGVNMPFIRMLVFGGISMAIVGVLMKALVLLSLSIKNVDLW